MAPPKRTAAEETRWVTHNAMCPRDDPAGIVRYAFQDAADECLSIDIVPVDEAGRLTFPGLEPIHPGFAPEMILDYILNDPRGGQGVYRLNLKDANGRTGLARAINVFLDRASANAARPAGRMPLGRSLQNTREALEETVAIGRATKFLRSLDTEEVSKEMTGQAEAMKAMADGFASIIKMQSELVQQRAAGTDGGGARTELVDLYKSRVAELDRKVEELSKTAPPSVLAEISKARELLTALGVAVGPAGGAAPVSVWEDPAKLSGYLGVGRELMGELRALVSEAIATWRGSRPAPAARAPEEIAAPQPTPTDDAGKGGRRVGPQDRELVSMALEALRSGDWPTLLFLLQPPNGPALLSLDPDPSLPPDRKPWPNPVVYRPMLGQLDEIFGLKPTEGFASHYQPFVEFIAWYRRLVTGGPLDSPANRFPAEGKIDLTFFDRTPAAPAASREPPPVKCGPRRCDSSGASKFCDLPPGHVPADHHAELVNGGLVEFLEVR